MPPTATPDTRTPPSVPSKDAARGGGAQNARRGFRFGLGMRVLLLNTAFVMIAATMVYIPAISGYRGYWLHNRLSAA
ncbi:MAG: hypothetical protein ACREDI_07410, partial [Roseiarcus sp.]